MKKKIIERSLIGFFIGIAIGQIISVLISLIAGKGEFLICAPAFTELMGSEAYAAALQTLLCGIMGIGYAIATLVWGNDELSIASQTGICFGIYSLFTFPIAYFTFWMEHSAKGVLQYVGIFFASFVFVWFIQYSAMKAKINAINKKLNE
ncbi:MAG: DUF3021 domain-containing protein [Oscillospiraceae bacterium]